MMKSSSAVSNFPSRTVKRWSVLLCASVLLPVGCKKKADETPTPEVYVQAAHPEQGSISEQIDADAILAPLAQAAISSKVTAPEPPGGVVTSFCASAAR